MVLKDGEKMFNQRKCGEPKKSSINTELTQQDYLFYLLPPEKELEWSDAGVEGATVS